MITTTTQLREAARHHIERRTSRRRLLAWQSWQLEIPVTWEPITIDGGFTRGHVLLADLHRPKIGLRWQTVCEKRVNPIDVVDRAMRLEIGDEAAENSTMTGSSAWAATRLHSNGELPGRDVFIAFDAATNRLVQLTYHTQRHDRVLQDVLAPTLQCTVQQWGIFDLQCQVPVRFRLASHKLLAGDLSLRFAAKRETLAIRQIAVASLALQNRSLDDWAFAQQRQLRHRYRIAAGATANNDGFAIRAMSRRRRFGLLRSLPSKLTTIAVRDVCRDRLLIVEASNEALARETLVTMMFEGAL